MSALDDRCECGHRDRQHAPANGWMCTACSCVGFKMAAQARSCAECFRPLGPGQIAFTDIVGNDFCRDCEREVRIRAIQRRA